MVAFRQLRKLFKSITGGETAVESTASKFVWIDRSKYISEAAHKVRVHSRDGKSEVRFVSDEELEVLRKEPNISRVVHVTEDKKVDH